MTDYNSKVESWNMPSNQIPEFKVDPIVVFILGVLTCELYHIYWNMKAAEVFNALAGREIISQPIAIFAGCLFPINAYFFYRIGKEGMPKLYERINAPHKDDTALLVILGFFFPMVSAMIVQSDINRLYN